MRTALVGDIGGTNARLALARFDGDAVRIDQAKVYPTHEHGSLEEVVADYQRAHAGERPEAICVAAAGPVSGGAVTMTNLGWRIAEDALAGLGFERAKVINDFAAQAYGIDQLGPDDIEPLGERRQGDPGAPAAIVGAGTGFGVAALFRGDGASVAVPGEGGHVGFAPNDAEEVAIFQLLAARFGHVSVERLLSGPGLVNLYQALGQIDGVATQLATPEKIGDEAQRGDPLATRAVQRFCSVYGSVAGDFALVYGAKGGVYLAGGLAPHLHAFLHHGRFREAFEGKGRYRDYLRSIPTAIVMDTFIALKGAAVALRHPSDPKTA